jgi:hypothetical protein
MVSQRQLSDAYHAILSGFVQDGRAPHYTELAVGMGMTPDEARSVQKRLISSLGGPHWLHPEADYIASFSPFSNIPTQYFISVGGQQRWYGQ